MQTKFKPSISSRVSVRGLIVACMPAAALGAFANSPVLGAVFTPRADQGLSADDNAGASTNGASPRAPGTNSGTGTNIDIPTLIDVQGVRR